MKTKTKPKKRIGILGFAWQTVQDAERIKVLYQIGVKLYAWIRAFGYVWSYISILLFAGYGISHGVQTGQWVFPTAVFCVCGAMLLVNTVLLALSRGDREMARHRQTALYIFHVLIAMLKIAMSILLVYSLVGMVADEGSLFRVVFCILTVLWVGVTLATDTLLLFLRIACNFVGDFVADRVEQAKEAVKNDGRRILRGVAALVRPLRRLPSLVGRKKIGKDANQDVKDAEKSRETVNA